MFYFAPNGNMYENMHVLFKKTLLLQLVVYINFCQKEGIKQKLELKWMKNKRCKGFIIIIVGGMKK